MSVSVENDVRVVGQNIAVKRLDAGYSQEKFSEMIGISKTALGKIERGESAPRTDTLISACRELRASPNEIMPEYLSRRDEIDPEMRQMEERVRTLSVSDKCQFYAMMNVVLNGLMNPGC